MAFPRQILSKSARYALTTSTLSLLGCLAAPTSAPDHGDDASSDAELGSASQALKSRDALELPIDMEQGLSWSEPIVAKPGPECVYTGSAPRAVGRRRAELRVLSQNTFGLDRDGNDNCEARAKTLGNIIANAWPPYDVVALQEHWNSWDAGIADCGADELSEAIWSTGRYTNSNNYWRHRPHGEWTGLDTDGGLSIFSLHPITKFIENEWDDHPGVVNMLQGSTFSRIQLPGSNISVDFYNTHLLAESADDCSPACRREEIEELREELLLYSKNSGNPVIIAGDFNIGGPPTCAGNDRYADIMELLENPRDLWAETHPGDPGFTADCAENTVLQDTSDCVSRERIDYMFVVTSPNLTSSQYEVVVREPSDLRLAKFTRANGKHVSDHFGLEARLELRNRGRVDTQFQGLAGKCLDVTGGASVDGSALQLSTCSTSAAQRWTLDATGQLRGIGGKCLTLRGASTANGTLAELRTCTGAANQRFDYTAAGELRSRLASNKCVEVRGGFTSDGTPIQLYDCNGTASQLWQDYVTPTCVAPAYACSSGCCTPPPEPDCYQTCFASCRADGMLPRQCVQMCRAECGT